MNKFLQKGFGILPLMVVVGTGALVAALAYFVGLPAYQNYQVQNQVAEVFVSANSCRAEINQMLEKKAAKSPSTAPLACDGGASSGAKISSHLKSIAVSPAGAITVTLDFRSLPELTPASNILTLVPLVDATHVLGVADVGKKIFAWRCGSPADGTSIPSQYLPADCRG